MGNTPSRGRSSGTGRSTGSRSSSGVRSGSRSSGTSRSGSNGQRSSYASSSSSRQRNGSSRNNMNGNARKKYYKKKRRSNAPRIALAALGFVLCIGLVGFGAYYLFSGGGTAIASSADKVIVLDNGTIPEGTTIDEVNVGGMTKDEARAALSSLAGDRADEYSVTLTVPGSDKEDEVLNGDDLGIRPDIDTAIEEAMDIFRHGTVKDRQYAIESVASVGNHIKTDFTFDESSIRSALASSELLSAEGNEPTAEFNAATATFTYTAGKEGLEVDMDKLVELVVEQVENRTFGTVEVPGERKASTKTVEELEANTKIRGAAETKFSQSVSASNPNRVHNIVTIANKLNGAKIMPGQEFSVNTHVGGRTNPDVWKPALGIADGDYTEQLGGGICQVSTTLYQALMKADMKITVRQNHSIAVNYASKGLDATISTGGPDLAFLNNTDWPIYIYVYVDTSSKFVRVRLYGQPLEEGLRIEFKTEQESEIPQPSPSIVTDPEKVRAGGMGAVVRTYKLYYKNDKLVDTVEAHKSTYKARAAYILDPSLSTPEPVQTEAPTTSESPVSPDTTSPPSPVQSQAPQTQAPTTPSPVQTQAPQTQAPEPPPVVDPTPAPPAPDPDPGSGDDNVIPMGDE